MKLNRILTLLLALTLILCGCSGEKEEAYRMIQVLEVSGCVSVQRENMGTFDAYEGMRFASGDKISVGADSWLKIKMDEDKYALVEPGSVLSLEASGSSADSKTVLHLEAGAVSNRLESKLSDASSYEVNTPNSTMAVRGTVFRVEVTMAEEGVSVTNVSVYGGSVASRLAYPDGSVDAEQRSVLIVDGTGAQIWGNDILSKYVTTQGEMGLDDLRLQTLEFLQEAQDAGQALEITPEELKELIGALEQSPEPVKETTAPTDATTAPAEETTAPTKETTAPTTAPRPVAPPVEEEPEYVPPATTQPPQTQAPTTQPTQPATYTVTFEYQGTPFATQTVTAGEKAAVPKLQPTPSGSWTGIENAITGDTVIEWNG